MSSANSVSVDKQLYNAAAESSFDEVKKLHAAGGNINMVIMGCFDGPCNPDGSKGPCSKEIYQYSLENGACILFGCRDPVDQQHKDTQTKPNSFFTRISMLKGPGEVAKGTFRSS